MSVDPEQILSIAIVSSEALVPIALMIARARFTRTALQTIFPEGREGLFAEHRFHGNMSEQTNTFSFF